MPSLFQRPERRSAGPARVRTGNARPAGGAKGTARPDQRTCAPMRDGLNGHSESACRTLLASSIRS